MSLRTSLKYSPNLIINSAFDFWQRSVGPVTASSTPSYLAMDRWQVESGGAGSVNFQRSTTVPSSAVGKYSVQTTQTGAGATSHRLWQRIEAAIIAPYVGKTLTFSLWFRTSVIDATMIGSIDVAVPLSTEDTWPTENTSATLVNSEAFSATGLGLSVNGWKRITSTFTVPASAVNGLCLGFIPQSAINGAVFNFAGAMLTEGPSAPIDFYRAGTNLANELVMCQRYYEKSYDMDVAPGSVANAGAYCFGILSGITNGNSVGAIPFKVTKRAVPTVTVYSGPTGVADRVRYNGTDIGVTSNTNNGVNASSIVNNNGAALATATVAATCQFAANAEL